MEFSNSHVKKQPSQKQKTICETKPNELPWMLKAFLYFNVMIAIYRSPKDWYIIAINVFIAHLSSTPEKAHQVHKTTLTLSVAGCMEVIAMEDPAKQWPLVAIYRSPKDWYIIAINVFIAHLSSTPEKAHQGPKTTLTLSVAGCMEVLAMEDPAKQWPLVACAIANLIASNLVLVMTAKSPPDDGSSCGFSKSMRWVIFVIANVAIALSALSTLR